jgi:hypothetical protein
MQEQADSLIPDLKARHAALVEELAREKQVVAEIEACDQEELSEYRAAIAEQESVCSS